jgi:FkbM family methyltransferase
MSIVSYAQNFEDIMLWRALKDVKQGFYLDVGGHSPDVFSVTRLFYDAGWTGLNVEPHPNFLAQLKARRLHDTNLGLAVSDFQGEADFHCIEETGLSALDKTVASGAVGRGFNQNIIKVPVTTLSDIWDEHIPQGQPVHFLKIDVEGHEEQVIRGADWKRHRPWIVVAEATEPLSTTQNHHAWDPLLLDAGYDFVWFDGLNRFYVAHEHAELADAFKTPPNVFDSFRTAQEVLLETRAATAEARLAETAKLADTVAGLNNTISGLSDTVAGLNNKISQLQHTAEMKAKPLWIRMLFRPSGRPKKPLRRALFHSNGKPRGVFRKWVLHADGSPHSPFKQWMSSPEYQSLPRAVRVSGRTSSTADALSPNGKQAFARIAAHRKSSTL